MAILPDWDELINSGLYGLEQYLAWALTEMRRLAIAEGQQQIVRLALGSEKLTTDDGDRYEGLLKVEVNLPYDSDVALADGLNFVRAIKNVSEGQAIAPTYDCRQLIADYLKTQLEAISGFSSEINTLERLLYWLLISWRLTNDGAIKGIKSGGFAFFDESSNGASVKFVLELPLNYQEALTSNLVCATYASPYRTDLSYTFPEENSQTDQSMGNTSDLNNSSQLGN